MSVLGRDVRNGFFIFVSVLGSVFLGRDVQNAFFIFVSVLGSVLADRTATQYDRLLA